MTPTRLIFPLATILGLLLAATPTPAQPLLLGDSCITGNRPGATLLFPYFEIDPGDPGRRGSLISIGNASEEPLLAHVVLWTNFGFPTLAFDVYLPAHAVQPLNLWSVLVAGRLPVTGPGTGSVEGSPGCTDPLTNPVLGAAERAELVARHTGRPSPADGLCYGLPDGRDPELAVGYVTVDAVNDCSAEIRFPTDPGYFGDGGTGLASNRNALWGDFFLIRGPEEQAQGFEAVSVVADAERFDGSFEQRDTFYRKFVGYDGSDDRAPLSSTHRLRFLNGGGFDGGTELLYWTEGLGPFAELPVECGELPGDQVEVVTATVRFRDQPGEEVADFVFEPRVRAARLPVGEEPLAVSEPFGSLDLQSQIFFMTPILPPGPEDLQSWVAPILLGGGRFSVGYGSTRLDDLCR